MIAESLSVVVWKWQVTNRPVEFKPQYVNILRAMIARNYPLPHRFICVTDDAKGLDSSVEVIPTPEAALRFASIPAPKGVRFPSSYRRLFNFSAAAHELFGHRILALDIDVVITGDLTPLLTANQDFVSWWDKRFIWRKIPGGIYLHRTGTLTPVFDTFDPIRSPYLAEHAGCKGSDQGWMSYLLYPPRGWNNPPTNMHAWTEGDGVTSIKWMAPHKPLPKSVRVVSTPGFDKPWTPALQQRHKWIKEHWHE